jgi:hypothetical protein
MGYEYKQVDLFEQKVISKHECLSCGKPIKKSVGLIDYGYGSSNVVRKRTQESKGKV